MGQIASWLAERTQNKVVDQIIDSTHKDVTQADPVLAEYFPVQNRTDFDYLGVIVEKPNILASVIGINGRAPVTKIGSWKEVSQHFIKVGLDFVFDEEDQIRMEKLRRQAAYQGITVQNRVMPDGTILEGEGDTLASYIFGKPADLVKSVNLIHDKLIWDVLQTGKVEHPDARTGITVSLDYVDPAETFTSFPSALSGNDRWDQYSTAKPLEDLETDCWAYEEANGTMPDKIVMSRVLFRHMYYCQSVIDAAATFSTGLTASKMNPSIVKRILEDRGLPPIEIFDRKYDYETQDGVRQKGRFLNTNRYVFVAKQMGERAFGPTIESKGGDIEGKPKPGIWLKTMPDPYVETKDIMKCRATILPLVYNPKYLFSRQAFTA